MELANLSEKFSFEIEGEIFSIEPCYYDENTPGLQINFPNESCLQVGLYNFRDFEEIKKFIVCELRNYSISEKSN